MPGVDSASNEGGFGVCSVFRVAYMPIAPPYILVILNTDIKYDALDTARRAQPLAPTAAARFLFAPRAARLRNSTWLFLFLQMH